MSRAIRAELLLLFAACAPARAVDVCARVDNRSALREYVVRMLDRDGRELARTSSSAAAPSSLPTAPDGTVTISVEGIGLDGSVRTSGRAGWPTDGSGTCVCVVPPAPSLASCENVTCTVAADRCAFSDDPTGVCKNAEQPCDGFENGLRTFWEPLPENGSIAVDSMAYRGGKSLKLHVDGIAAGAIGRSLISTSHPFVAPRLDHFFVRAFTYLSLAQRALIMNISTTGGGEGIDLTVQDDGTLSLANYASAGGNYHPTSFAFPIGRWTCVEWEVTLGTAGQMNVWVDDQAVTGLTVNEPTEDAQNRIAKLRLGLRYFAEPNAYSAVDLWLDEVAVDSVRIGCN